MRRAVASASATVMVSGVANRSTPTRGARPDVLALDHQLQTRAGWPPLQHHSDPTA